MPKLSNIYPKRGEIFIADLNPGLGHEIHKKRPIVVISSDTLNKVFPTIIFVPFSSIVPEFIGPDVIKMEEQRGLDKKSVIITSQIRSIDKQRLVKKIGRFSSVKLAEVEKALQLVLGMVELD